MRARYEALRHAPGADPTALAREEAQVLEATHAGERAVRAAFARAVARVFDWALILSLCALVLAVFTREIPLRRTNAPAP
ncbi:hypothetical protein [Melittangium boletus]|uniref:hypothetical protein n=1 Tax=Melittangium boletus TaxID=83453 RepID=UPI003DA2ED86